uniref:Uncharacterized protein n=1 Tax=Anguilla anguilla TaxID=7936 RepID=A0A0E9XER0_ANGAN
MESVPLETVSLLRLSKPGEVVSVGNADPWSTSAIFASNNQVSINCVEKRVRLHNICLLKYQTRLL